jgi:hypothetical protein
MPVVPRNTISEPQVPRLPQVGMAKPRIAEAMGAVAGALGGRAASIGRLASAAGDMVGVLERNYERGSAIAEARYKGQMAKANAISSIGSTLVQTGETIDRIYERRSREQADNALTEYTDYMTRTSNGYYDPSPRQRIPGTLEPPYSPGNEQDEATGPSVATAKAVKEWMEREDGTYAKLSPAAKAEFDQRAARITQSVMDRAMRQEYDQMQAFRQANDKAAFEADRKHVASLGVDVSPAGNEQWMIDMMAARDAQVMREVGRYQKDPSNGSVAKAEWLQPDVASYANQAATQVMETFTADRVEALLLAARNEPDDARREALLATAVGTAGMEHAGKRVLAEEAFQKAKLEADEVRLQASSMKAAKLKSSIDRANDLKAQAILTGDPKAAQELDGLLQTLPPHVAIEIRQTQDAAHYQREMAMLEDAKADWLSVIGTPQESAVKEKMLLVAQGMTNERARLRAPAVIQSAETTKATAFQTARADELEMAVWLGGRKGPDGSFISMTDAQLTTEVANADIAPAKARDLMKQLAERKDRDPVVEKKIYEALDGILGIDADASFKLADGMFEYETRTKDGKTVPVAEAESTIAEITVDERRFLPDRTVKLKAELIRNVAQDAYDYYRQQKTLSKDGKEPMSIEAYVRKRLMPDENEDARAWTEADIDLRIKQGQREREKMRLLFLEQMSNANEPAAAIP